VGDRAGSAPLAFDPRAPRAASARVTSALAPANDRRWHAALVVIVVAAIIRLAFAALIPVFPDEAYYWEWSRRLAAGYFDHPPGIAIVIRIGSEMAAPFRISSSAFGLRLGTTIAAFIASLATVMSARHIAGSRAALRAALVMATLPLSAAGLVLATPDVPVLAAEAIALYCVVRALDSDVGSRGSFVWWTATGIALGAAFASKYTSIFLPVGATLAILLRPSLRARFREPGPYMACIVATLVFLPVLRWNADHAWVSFLYQVKHGLAAPEGSLLRAAWRHEGDFFGGQAGLITPILFVLTAMSVWRALESTSDDRRFLLAVVSLLTFAFFTYSAIRQRVEPNWPSPAYIPAIILVATHDWSSRGARWFTGGVVLAGIVSVVIYAQAITPILPLPPARDPIARAFGWRELATAAVNEAEAQSAESGKTTWLGGDRYQEAAELAFWSRGNPTTFATNFAGRPNQYDLWPAFAALAKPGDNFVLVLDETDELHAAIRTLRPYFQSVNRGMSVPMMRGQGHIGSRRIWTLAGWRGGWPSADSAAVVR
jgi:4-amino-4-deoxy-L-arabinose transferase-like glycosyltransferase